MPDKARHILKSAERLFAGGRYHEVTVDEIAKRAGVGKGTIYRYFGDKEDLYYQVILSGLDELIQSVEQVGRQEEDPACGLRHVARRVVDFFTQRQALFGLMWSEQFRRSKRKKCIMKQWRQKTDRLRTVMATFIADGVADGRYACPFSPPVAASLLNSMIRVGVRSRDELDDSDGWPEAIVDLFENGILIRDAQNPKSTA